MVFLFFIIFLFLGAGVWQLYSDYSKTVEKNSKHFSNQSSMKRNVS